MKNISIHNALSKKMMRKGTSHQTHFCIVVEKTCFNLLFSFYLSIFAPMKAIKEE